MPTTMSTYPDDDCDECTRGDCHGCPLWEGGLHAPGDAGVRQRRMPTHTLTDNDRKVLNDAADTLVDAEAVLLDFFPPGCDPAALAGQLRAIAERSALAPKETARAAADPALRVKRSDIPNLPNGTLLRGLAPIGVRWFGLVKRGKVVPDEGCPKGEFALTDAWVGGTWVEVEA
jgi:hypothetical protein